MEKGVWYKKPYLWRQIGGEFFEWDGVDYRKPMVAEDVKKKLFPTESGKFELKSSHLEKYADFVNAKLGVSKDTVGYPQWLAPRYSSEGDLFLVTPKTAMHAEGRSANMPQAIALYQPVSGGRNEMFLEMHPKAAAGARHQERRSHPRHLDHWIDRDAGAPHAGRAPRHGRAALRLRPLGAGTLGQEPWEPTQPPSSRMCPTRSQD